MSLTAAELLLLAGELNGLAGARVQKAWASGPTTATLELRLPGESVLVLCEAGEGVGRAAVVAERPRAPERPLAFQELLRAQLRSARLDRARAEGRTLRFDFSTDRGPRSLLLRLAPRGGALVLVDGEERTLGSSPGAGLVGAGREPAPSATSVRFAAGSDAPFPLSRAIEAHYAGLDGQRRLERARAALLGPLRAALKRLTRTRAKVDQDLARIAAAGTFRELGDLLKPHLSRLKRGQTVAKVTRWTESGPKEVEVPLVPALGPKENLERYYHQHRRLSRSAGRVQARRRQLSAELEACAALLSRASAARDEEELAKVERDGRAAGLWRPPRTATRGPPAPERRPYREFVSRTGASILVGRSARDNDALTFGLARGNDLWLHARGRTGSHVVVPGSGPDGPDGETVLDAATLAAHFSSGRDERVVDVAVTRRKHVQKPKGVLPGAVRFTQDRTLPVRLEPARVERLLAGERQA